VGEAPVTLVYVSDYAKLEKVKQPELQAAFTNADVGFIGQNVYLFCASEGLAAWFRTTDREGLAKAMNLRPEQHVLYAQSVGHPAKK
jgi:nitroreductase